MAEIITTYSERDRIIRTLEASKDLKARKLGADIRSKDNEIGAVQVLTSLFGGPLGEFLTSPPEEASLSVAASQGTGLMGIIGKIKPPL